MSELAHHARLGAVALNTLDAAIRRCASHNTGTDIPAVYLWITAAGNELPLCEACCAAWRAGAAAEPDFAPLRITMFTGLDASEEPQP